MQENWIGKSEGVRFAFTHDIRGADGELIGDGRMYVFTTRADTIMGVTFCAVAPEHPLATHAAQTNPQLAAFIEECKKGGTTEAELALREKEGMPTGLAVHASADRRADRRVGRQLRADGLWRRRRDGRARPRRARFRVRPQVPACRSCRWSHVDGEHYDYKHWHDWYADKERGVTINSDIFSGFDYKDAVNAVAHALEQKGLGEKKTTWRLRDWGVSRQRYWGTPIPIIHCDEHGAVPVPEKDLPVVLPQDCVPDGTRQPAEQARGLPGLRVPGVRQGRRGARPTPWTPSSIRPGTSCATATRRTTSAMVADGARLLDADGPVHRRHRARHPAPAVRALLDQGDARPRAW